MISFKNYLTLLIFIFLSASGICQSEIKITVLDKDTKNATPVRVRITDDSGRIVGLPNEVISIMYGRDDRPERYSYQPDSSFYVDGNFNLDLEEGIYNISLSKGMEYLDQTHEFQLKNGEHREFTYEMQRWIDMNKEGWYSADDHIHIRRSPRENPLILKWVEAEGLNVGVILQMGDFWTTYFSQYAFGEDGVYKENESMLSTGQEEPRTHEVGHTIAMVADDFVRFSNDYYYYDKVFDKVHDLNGIMGYAHQGMSFNGFRGMTMDVLAGKVDFLELLQFCVEGGPLLTQNYYHFLDLGFKLTATAGSDFPWCGNGPLFGTEAPSWNARIGNTRFFTHIDSEFKYESWKQNVKAGHTFVSSGPMLEFSINDQLPGDELRLNGKSKVSIKAKAFGHAAQIPLSKMEIIAHGKVIKEITPESTGQSMENLTLEFDLEIEHGIWIAARCFAGPTQIAHTTPVYITINDQGFHNPETLQDYLVLNEQYLQELVEEIESEDQPVNKGAWWYKKGLKQRIHDTRKVIKELQTK